MTNPKITYNLYTKKAMNNNNLLAYILFLFICFVIIKINNINNNLYDYQNLIKEINNNQITQLSLIHTLNKKIKDNEDLIQDVFDIQFHSTVVATMYHPVPSQTDDTPNITADGTVFDISKASEYKYIAISRDLHKRYGGDFGFNDIVYVKSEEVSGFFIIKDLMNERFTKRIDFLHTPNTPQFKLEEVELYATNIKQII